jgi:hypothetical protein
MAFLIAALTYLRSRRAAIRSETPDIRINQGGPPTGPYELSPFGGVVEPGSRFDSTIRVTNHGPGRVKDIGFCAVSRGLAVYSVPIAPVLEGLLDAGEEFVILPFFGGADELKTGDAIRAATFATDSSGAVHGWGSYGRHHRFRKRRFREPLTALEMLWKLYPAEKVKQIKTSHVAKRTQPRSIRDALQ